MSSRTLIIRGVLLLLPVVCSGCSGPIVERTDVIGWVTLDGHPVEEAHVYLVSTAQGPESTVTGDVVDGMFEVGGRKGPPPGKYQVILHPIEPDPEELLLQVPSRRNRPLRDRHKLLAALARRGLIQVDLSLDILNEITIELTSR